LFASTVVIPQGNLHSVLLPSAYAQQEEEEDETGTAEAQVSEEEELEPEPTDLTAVISANDTSGDAPLTVDFNATIAGGTEPYTISWDFGDGDVIEDSDEQSVVHTFDEAGTYTVALSVTDSEDQTVSDSIEVTVEEGEEPEPVPPGEGGVDKWGIEEVYATADGGPAWYILEQSDPTADGHFYYGMYRTTTIEYSGSGVWRVDARSGTQEHGIRMHVDSPTGTWKNTEMTGYFYVVEGSDQFTMIARHGPSYHDNNGCEAYGYYGMTAIDGNVFFKKKLYHFNDGYTKRLAQVSALDNLSDEWVGMKFVVYDLPNGDVKLELWIDKGDMTNNWNKVTELVDSGNLAVEGGNDCSRDATDSIEDGTRASFRADNMMFDFKKLSVREIQASSTAEVATTAEDPLTEDTTTEDTTTEDTTTEDTTTEDTTTEDTTTEDTTTEDDLTTEILTSRGLSSWLN
jgi:PKD repeat protein